MKKILANLLMVFIILSVRVAYGHQELYKTGSSAKSRPTISVVVRVLPRRAFALRKGSTMSKRIPLTQGKFAIVDDEDFEYLNQFNWCANKIGNTYYAVRVLYLGGGRKNQKRKKIFMHRQILNAQDGEEVDHRNHCTLDNRKQNIRFCTHSQNNQNRNPYKNTSSKFKGVSWNKRDKKWEVQIMLNGKTIHLGLFFDEIEAANAYDDKARELFSEFAKTNF